MVMNFGWHDHAPFSEAFNYSSFADPFIFYAVSTSGQSLKVSSAQSATPVLCLNVSKCVDGG